MGRPRRRWYAASLKRLLGKCTMSYETDQLINQVKNVFYQMDNKSQSIESRLWQAEQYIEKLQQFMVRAEPYIKSMELINPPEKQTP